ncbi:HEAT repeat domain-containing protein [Calothrix sp. CCY 0018]|uniref:HEAT repeat domain-containing protein n=1 Tax=Calothrix sp. CCY 0018 TaxID=3103864 RepID=UPI0039C6C5FE
MTTVNHPKFQSYLQSIGDKYKCWGNIYTLTDVEYFDFGLMVQEIQPKQERKKQEEEKTPPLPVLEGIRKYAEKHVLLRGKPGSGKSTALQQLLWEDAQALIQGKQRKIPVLVELRNWDTFVEKLIYKFLRKNKHRIDISEIEDLLFDGELLLLMDGLNELASDEARDNVARFRQDYSETPMIFTTRDLGLGGNLGIDKQLEMQPLTEKQMREFVIAYLPQQGEQMLQQLDNRLRELGETPLILKMLCDVFKLSGEIPKNRGELFRKFDSKVNQLKEDKETVPIPEGLRRWKRELLEYLAFEMMQPKNPQENPTNFQLSICRSDTEAIFENFLKGRVEFHGKAKDWLDGLLKHCLLESKASESERDTIEFHHQLFQEYYAAEYLLRLLPNLSDAKLKRDYLNLLKWTESIALILSLVEHEAQALRVVRLGLEVDLMLGARLAGEVRKEFQEKTKSIINQLEIPQINKNLLLNKQSKHISHERRRHEDNMIELGVYGQPNIYFKDGYLVQKYNSFYERKNKTNVNKKEYFRNIEKFKDDLKSQDFMTRFNAAKMLGDIGSDSMVDELCQAYDAEFTQHPMNFVVRAAIINALEEIGSDKAIQTFDKALSDENFGVRNVAVNGLLKIGSESVVNTLVKALKDEESYIRESAVEALGMLGYGKAISELHNILLNEHEYSVFWRVAEALKLIQERYKFYNHEIFHSLPIEEQENNQNSKYSINAETVQIIEKNDGNVYGK